MTENTFGQVKSVDHYRGATLVETYRSGQGAFKGAFTLGPYITAPRGTKIGSDLFMHEYGHYRQSRWLGPLYTRVIAGPSFLSALTNGFGKGHKNWYTERWANNWSLDFFDEDFQDYYNREYGENGGNPWGNSRYGYPDVDLRNGQMCIAGNRPYRNNPMWLR